jgi:hypothetical protein
MTDHRVKPPLRSSAADRSSQRALVMASLIVCAKTKRSSSR